MLPILFPQIILRQIQDENALFSSGVKKELKEGLYSRCSHSKRFETSFETLGVEKVVRD